MKIRIVFMALALSLLGAACNPDAGSAPPASTTTTTPGGPSTTAPSYILGDWIATLPNNGTGQSVQMYYNGAEDLQTNALPVLSPGHVSAVSVQCLSCAVSTGSITINMFVNNDLVWQGIPLGGMFWSVNNPATPINVLANDLVTWRAESTNLTIEPPDMTSARVMVKVLIVG